MIKRFLNFCGFLFRAARAYFRKEPVLTSHAQQALRLDHCEVCEHRCGSLCGICGCVIRIKTAMQFERCPDSPSRWR